MSDLPSQPRHPVSLLVTGCAAVLLAGFGLLFHDGRTLLGSPGGEVYGHAWVQWWHAAALPGWPSGTDLARGTASWPVIDPLPTAFAAVLARLSSLEVGYDAWILLSVGLAFAGGAWLARLEGGSPLVGGLVLSLAPIFVGSLASGLTEDGSLGLAAVALGLVGRPGWRANLAAGALLGLLAWCGLVLAWYAAVAAVLLGLAALVRERGQVLPLAGGAALAGLIALPLALAQGDRLAGAGHRGGAVATQVEPLWRLNPWRGADLLSFVAPGHVDVGDALIRMHPGYLGLAVLAVAAFAGRSRWWWVLGFALLVAPGRELSVAGQPLGVANPFVTVVGWLPGGDLLNHHGRAVLLASVALSALASRGAAVLGERFGPAARRAVPMLVGADLLFLSPLAYPLPVASSEPLSIVPYLDKLPDGPLLVVPAGGPGVHFQRPLIDQRWHGRPLVLSPNRPGLPGELQQTPTGRWLGGLAFDGGEAPEKVALPGVAVLVVLEPWVPAVAVVLGEPRVMGPDASAWAIEN